MHFLWKTHDIKAIRVKPLLTNTVLGELVEVVCSDRRTPQNHCSQSPKVLYEAKTLNAESDCNSDF